MKKLHLFITLAAALTALTAFSQDFSEQSYEPVDEQAVEQVDVTGRIFPAYRYLPVVFDTYDMHVANDSLSTATTIDADAATAWVDDIVAANNRFRSFKQRYVIDNPQLVRYNIATMPEAPKHYIMNVDPSTARIDIREVVASADDIAADISEVEVKRTNWLQDFEGMVQFSQAYVSPNWYQGGNNNLNVIANAIYNIKLNQAFHPNLLFENTVQYKLALNSAPDDSLRNYSISEDIFQVNSKFGIRAAKRWYYSATLQFKTQLLNNYKTNTRDLNAAFLSPGELNVGLGMTYEYISPSKKFNFNISIAPLSYNLKFCTNRSIDETQFGIDEGKTSVSQYGSNIDCKITWQLAYNINYTSHLTAFSDYSYIQSDWEHTFSFSINRFLSTQLYLHLRYDSQTPHINDSGWQKLQLKEILSFGFAYKFNNAPKKA